MMSSKGGSLVEVDKFYSTFGLSQKLGLSANWGLWKIEKKCDQGEQPPRIISTKLFQEFTPIGDVNNLPRKT